MTRTTGVFRWRVRPWKRSRARTGAIAGRVAQIGGAAYRYIGIKKRAYRASQLAWLYVHGEWPKSRLNYKNGDSTDDRIENLVESEGLPNVREFDLKTSEGRKAYHRERRGLFQRSYRDYDLRRDFGISAAEYDALLATQNGVCAICQKPERAKRGGRLKMLAVDHCHRTNKIRGLLCSNCNPMIGYAQEDAARLAAAVRYLKRHNGA
jgi:hypothetical protein